MEPRATTSCLAEDELLAIARAGSLADQPALESHIADCATCSSLVAAVLERAAAPPWDALAGTRLAHYALEAQLGAGGMGAVYRARDTKLERAVAIKVLHTQAHASRLATEARAAAAIGHRAIVAIHDVGEADGVTYIAMELVDGESLRSVLERGALPYARACELAIELADALAAAHARGVIHRDLKPENLVLARDGRLRVLDFGLAKLAGADPLDATEPGTVQGTAGYMAPEQARGEPTDARVDLFATGAIVFELVTGRRAFPGATHADRLSAVLRDDPPLDGVGALAPVVERCLAKDPSARFHAAADLGWALRHAAAPQVATSRSISRRGLLAGAGAAALAGVGGFVVGRQRSRTPSALRAEYRQLTFRTGRISTARFTPDGMRVAFGAAWDVDPVRGFVADLGSGTTSRTDIAGDILAVSRRGELAISLGRHFTLHQSATGTLAVVPLAGGAQRVLAPSVQDADFAPDGSLAVTRATPDGFVLEAPFGTPLVTSKTWITHPRVSPDGRRIAYLEHPDVNDDAGDLVVVEIASRAARVLAPGWSSIAGLAWDPSGASLWFTAGREHGVNELHEVRLDGTLRPIAQATGRMRLHDLASDRRVAISVDTWRLRSLIGTRGGTDRDASLSEASFVVDVSADGATFAIAELGNADTARGIYLVPAEAGPALRLGDGFPLAISPSGQRVAANTEAGVVIYSTASGERVAVQTPGHVMSARWIDETTLVASAKRRLWRLSSNAAPVALTGEGVAGRLAIDAARTRCGFVNTRGELHIVGLSSGTDRVLARDLGHKFACGWLREPDAIVVSTATTPLELVRVDPQTGASEPFTTLQPPPVGLKAVDSLVLHHDGARYAYSYGQELSQLYLMTLAHG